MGHFDTDLGTETLAAITPRIVNITADALSRFNPKDRDCYTDSEFSFKDLKWEKGFRYSMMNCLYQVIVDYVTKTIPKDKQVMIII